MMEQLADNGNGNFAYIDSISEARKVLVNEMGSTLHTIASDVKFQLEFNPALVESYRLIGYENRVMAARDFDDDKRDAGEIGAGHTVTALYEIVPAGAGEGGKDDKTAGGDVVRTPKYLQTDKMKSAELGVLRLRWKNPGSEKSELSEIPLLAGDFTGARATEDQRFAASVAAWGMLLRDSDHKGSADIDSVITDVKQLLGDDPEGYRAEFLSLLYKTRELMR
jgi:Ca-activated chloride channel family protein